MSGTIETVVDRERDFTLYTVHGEFTAEQVNQVTGEFFAGQPTTLTLWDFSDAEYTGVSGTDPRLVADMSQQFEGQRVPEAKTALVFTREVGYGLGRMFETFRELKNTRTAYRSFRTREEALCWLGLDPAD